MTPVAPIKTPWGVDADGRPIYRIVGPRPEWLALVREEALEPALQIIDPHHHFWDHHGNYFLDELMADLNSGHHVLGTVYLQCGHAYDTGAPPALQPVGETAFAAGIAREAARRANAPKVCAGIVAYADMMLGDAVRPVLEAHVEAGGGRFRGTRHISARHEGFNASLLGRPPADLFNREGFRRGLKQLQALGLSFDAWLYHTQIDDLAALARDFPDLPIVLDHVGGPLAVGPYAGRRDASFAEWRKAMAALAGCPNVHMKLGGLAMAICGYEFHKQPKPPTSQQLADAWGPYFQTSVELFGARRCMFESNFPVDKAMCSYAVLWNAFKRSAAGASTDEKAWLFRNTANSFYRLGLA